MLKERIRELLKQKNAILIAHNYQRPEVQEVADLCGDSLELSMKASRTDAEVIVFCGVHFMAETAAILSPKKTVLLPVLAAGCPMADMITVEALRRKKKEMPDAVVVSYVNTTAEVKAESDICCTSANVVRVVKSIEPGRKILMTPDKNLAQYAMKESGRELSYWKGFCPTHNRLTAAKARKARKEYPNAIFMAHPECRQEVLEMADVVTSTSGMIAYPDKTPEKEFIVGTETGILHPLTRKHPDKVFYPADPEMVCPNMKMTHLEDVLAALENMAPVVSVPENIRVRALKAVEKMLALPADRS